MKVLHVCPTFFSESSFIGGAERYTWELARAMNMRTETSLLTFGPERRDEIRDGVRVQTLGRLPFVGGNPMAANPFVPAFVRAVKQADVVHAYQVNCLATNAAVLAGRMTGTKVFVTDLGGGDVFAPSNYVPLMRLASGYLLVSEYSKAMWEKRPASRRPAHLGIIYAGADVDYFSPAGDKDPSLVVYVGRIVPHKGLEHLIDAIEAPLTLRVAGRPYDQEYMAFLRDRARDKPVVFEHDLSDDQIRDRYRRALVFALPSVSTDFRGKYTASTELFGLVLIEAMACGTPVIVTREASHPEIVQDGVTGLIVPPADPAALRRVLLDLHARPEAAFDMGRRARADVVSRFTWAATADRCLAEYAKVPR